MIEGSDGALYGTTFAGGSDGIGVVFRIQRDGSGFTKLHDFELTFRPWPLPPVGRDGAYPHAGVVEGSDGSLYGTTLGGGGGPNSPETGVVYKISRDGTGFRKLHEFDGVRGSFPTGLMEGSDAVLYGIAAGGAGGWGVLYRLGRDGTGFKVLHEFDYTNGAFPWDRLVEGFTVPDGVSLGTSYARFRLSRSGGLAPGGPAPDGEVEDYKVALEDRPNLVVNGGFEQALGGVWRDKGLEAGDGRTCRAPVVGACSFKMVSGQVAKALVQRIRFRGAAGDRLSFGATGRAEQSSASYSVDAVVAYDNGGSDRYSLSFTGLSGTNTLNTTVIAKRPYKQVRLELRRTGGRGRVWFDEVVLTRH